jgi:hypothetical protein
MSPTIRNPKMGENCARAPVCAMQTWRRYRGVLWSPISSKNKKKLNATNLILSLQIWMFLFAKSKLEKTKRDARNRTLVLRRCRRVVRQECRHVAPRQQRTPSYEGDVLSTSSYLCGKKKQNRSRRNCSDTNYKSRGSSRS